MQISGIYALSFEGTDKVYIGLQTNIQARYESHIQCLKAGRSAKKLQKAYTEYGIPALNILEEIADIDAMYIVEKLYISEFDSLNNGFNSLEGGAVGAQLPGESNGRALFQNEQYIQVLNLLAHTQLNITKIAEVTNTTVSVVQHISNGQGHSWLKDVCPIEFAILQNIRDSGGRFGIQKSSGRKFAHIFSPDGVRHDLTKIQSLTSFCTEYGLSVGHITNMLNGLKKSYKGWYCTDKPIQIPDTKVISPEGEIFTVSFGEYTKFAKMHGMDPAAFRRVIIKEAKSHHGWKLYDKE